MTLEICADCEKVFDAGPKSHLCKACRRKRLSRYAKERGLNKLGNAAYSAIASKKKTENEVISDD